MAFSSAAEKPNFVLVMCDDLGWGDTGFNGNEVIKTPHLDRMAAEGAIMTRFYSVGPVCSPTRASFLTGRHYYRMGVWTANVGHLPKEEFTIARMLKMEGYATGHFGKWHLGTLSKTISAKGKKRRPEVNFAPPWLRDYDSSFVTESATATWNPAKGRRAVNNPYFENGKIAIENLDGCDSRVLMDRAIPFIQESVESETPFVAVIWFHAPHEDILAGPEYLAMYEGHGEAAHYYGCVTAVDDQVGRLRVELESLGVADNTVMFFCSDNGPEGKGIADPSETRRAGVTGGYSGRKRSVLEGGVRVPALALWPGEIEPGSRFDAPCSVLDYLPTVGAIIDASPLEGRLLDGESILPILQGKVDTRQKPIPFRYGKYAGLVEGRYKLIIESYDDGTKDRLFDLLSDKTESRNIVRQRPETALRMRKRVLEFLKSAKSSHAGADYEGVDYSPVDAWRELGVSGVENRRRNE